MNPLKLILALLFCLILFLAGFVGYIIGNNHCTKAKRMYQIDVVNDSVFLYNGKDLIGYYLATNQSMKSGMDSLILKDNQ